MTNDISQQQQIEQGLKSGQLTDAEAARLERDESRIENQQGRDLQNGNLSASENARSTQAFDAQGNRINKLEANNKTGVSSGSTTRLEADIQRNINQQERIDRGVDRGSLTATEVGSLETGQAGVDKQEAGAANNNLVTNVEQQNIQAAENGQSQAIRSDATNGTVAFGATTSNTANLNSPANTTTVTGGVTNTNAGVSLAGAPTAVQVTNANTTSANTTSLASVNTGVGVTPPTTLANTATTANITAAPVTAQPSMATRVGLAHMGGPSASVNVGKH